MNIEVTEVLTNDHRQVDALIEQVLTGDATTHERAGVINRFIRELSLHAVAEEVVVYPAVREELTDGNTLADEAIAEHQRIERALAELDGSDPEDPRVLATVAELALEFRPHVDNEEHTLFAQMRAEMSRQRLETLARQVEKVKSFAPTHPHPTAPDRPPGNLIVGPMVGLVDRLRDAISR
jgi:hemerythrin superfamily protein